MESTYQQVGKSLIVVTGLITSGITVGYPAVAWPAFQNATTGDINSAGLILGHSAFVSGGIIAMLLGAVAVGPILDTYGRRVSNIIATIAASAGFLIMGMSRHVVALFFGRILSGFAMGVTSPSASVYLAEITSPRIRGPATAAKNIAFSVGITIAYIVGAIFKHDWNAIALTSSLVPVLSVMLTIKNLPETEVWKNRKEGKIVTYRLFWKELRKRPEVSRPVVIMIILLALKPLTGSSIMYSYAIDLAIAAEVKSDPYFMAICIGVTRILAGCLAASFSKWYGRRRPVVYNSYLMALSMIFLARLIFIKNTSSNLKELTLLVFIFSSTIASTVANSILGEVFPTDLRGICSSITTSAVTVSNFVALFTYPWLMAFIETAVMFKVYGTLCVINAVTTILLMPETNGKTLEEIQEIFSSIGNSGSAGTEDIKLVETIKDGEGISGIGDSEGKNGDQRGSL